MCSQSVLGQITEALPTLSLGIYRDRNISKLPNSEIQRSSKEGHGARGWGTTVPKRQIWLNWNGKTVVFSEMKPQTAGVSLSYKDTVTS